MKFILWLLLVIPILGKSETCSTKGPNVIVFTWDGVRTSDFFKSRNFPHFWSALENQAMVIGGRGRMKVGSKVAVSLPSYQAMMSGVATNCLKNNCGPIQHETVLERVQRELDLPKKDVAVFASWEKIVHATGKSSSSMSLGVFPELFDDGSADPILEKIQRDAMKDLPNWKGARKDKYTFELGRYYLKKHCPRLLWISLVDSDEYGHAGDYQGYLSSLKTYDQYLKTLLDDLNNLGEYGKNTTVMVTTDHSRGVGPFWKGHGYTKSSEKSIFLAAFGRGVEQTGRTKDQASLLQLKPTIEALMGLETRSSLLPGIDP